MLLGLKDKNCIFHRIYCGAGYKRLCTYLPSQTTTQIRLDCMHNAFGHGHLTYCREHCFVDNVKVAYSHKVLYFGHLLKKMCQITYHHIFNPKRSWRFVSKLIYDMCIRYVCSPPVKGLDIYDHTYLVSLQNKTSCHQSLYLKLNSSG